MRERSSGSTGKATGEASAAPGSGHPPQVGVLDPERRSSPIQTDPDQSFELLREQVGDETVGCLFNDVAYRDGEIVASGSTYLRCERGIWVEAGDQVP